MKTRSQTKSESIRPDFRQSDFRQSDFRQSDFRQSDFRQLYDVKIDFDEASEAWKANKKSIGNGSYKYVCAKRSKNNKICAMKCLSGEDFCKTHLYIKDLDYSKI
jgi:uncharacterized protein YjbI with pentapeptide repeats